MKKSLTVLLFLLISVALFAQEDQSMQQDESTKAWMEFMTPGSQHETLAKGIGDWKVKNTYWFAPGMDPQVSEGTATGKMILGGRYLLTEHKGNIMGMPFEGMSIEAYDNGTGKFVSIWIDNMGTGVAYAEGHYDEETGSIVYEGTMTDPMTKEAAWFKETTKHKDDNTFVMEMYMKGPDGTEFKNMEIELSK